MTKEEFDIMRLMVMLNAGYAYDKLPEEDRILLYNLMVELAKETDEVANNDSTGNS